MGDVRGHLLIPDGQVTTRFTFKSIDAKQLDRGNVLDDIVFDKAYRLSYDKNATDANGSVPSDETAGTVKQAKASTTGTLRLASDDDVVEYAANGLPKQLVNSDFDHDWRNIVSQSKMTDKYNFANIDPAHGDVEISGGLNSKGEASKQWVHLNGFDAAKFGWKSNQTDTRVDGRGGIVEIQRSRANDNMYAEITASQANTYLYQDIDTAHDYPTVYTVKLRYAHRNGTINSNEKIQILVGAPGHEQPVEMTRIASDRGNRLGEKSTTVNAPNTDGWLGSWDTFQGSVVVPAGQNVSRFTFKALGSIDGISGNLIDDVQFKLAYKLSYDKNSQDASGQVPSNTTPDTTQTASSKSTGKVSDLVQRTTTHEDGSVTVKTIDTSTDVVSGCQVYYPAGQRITLRPWRRTTTAGIPACCLVRATPSWLEPGPERDPGAGPGHDGRGRHDRVRGVGRQPGPHLRHEQAEYVDRRDAVHPGVRERAVQHGRGGWFRLAGGRRVEAPRIQIPRLVHGTAG